MYILVSLRKLEFFCKDYDKKSILLTKIIIIILYLFSVQKECAEALCRELRDEKFSCLETFDIKFTALNSGEEYNRHGNKMDMRVQFQHGRSRPEILLVKQNESKIAIFELACLHR